MNAINWPDNLRMEKESLVVVRHVGPSRRRRTPRQFYVSPLESSPEPSASLSAAKSHSAPSRHSEDLNLGQTKVQLLPTAVVLISADVQRHAALVGPMRPML